MKKELKYTDYLFSMPIRIFDAVSMRNAEQQEAMSGTRTSADFVVGVKKIYPEDIDDWGDGYSKETTFEEIAEDGFPCTIVNTKEGTYLCNWNREKFEHELNKHVEFIIKNSPEDREEDLDL